MAPAAVAVHLLAPTALALPDTVEVSGMLAADEELVSGFQVAGRLAQLDVDVGDLVAAGALVAALDARDFELGVDRARAALTSARARLGLAADGGREIEVETTAPVREAQAVLADAQLARQRVEELARQSLRPLADLDSASAAVDIARSRLQAARDAVRTWIAECAERQIDLELAQKRAQDARLLAPWPGVVAQRRVAPGRYVQVGEAVLTLLRVDPLRLRLRVPERLAGQARSGQRVDFSVDGIAGERHTGTVTRLGAAIDAEDRTLLVEATVDNHDGALRPGGFCRAAIVTAPARSVLAVPTRAVQSFAGVDRVFVVADGKARELLIELGRRQGDLVEVTKGLVADQLVVADPRGLVQGTACKVGD